MKQSVPRTTHYAPKAGGIILIHRSFVKRQVNAENQGARVCTTVTHGAISGVEVSGRPIYNRSITAEANSEVFTSFAPSIWRAKS